MRRPCIAVALVRLLLAGATIPAAAGHLMRESRGNGRAACIEQVMPMTAISTFSATAQGGLLAQDRMPEEINDHDRAQGEGPAELAERKETIAVNGANGSNGAGANTLASTAASILSDRKTHLAIGVAATLGLMVFYSWREKNLAKTDPEEYARIQRIKASVRNTGKDSQAQAHKSGKSFGSGKDEQKV